MDINEVVFLSATELGRYIGRKEISPVEATEAYLRRIEKVEPQLNAFITVPADHAMESARQAEAEIAAGTHRSPLHGVPVAVKDQIHTAGILTTSGSKFSADFVPPEDATAVHRLKQAGAVMVGKTNMAELAFGGPTSSAFGATRNPWDLTRDAGSSSNGSGAATAAFMCATSLGEDTGGSIRNPSAKCGLVGLRPSWGRVSRFGVERVAWSLDTVGPMSRTVEDCSATLGIIAGHDSRDPYSWNAPVPNYQAQLTGDIAGVKIGLVEEFCDPAQSTAAPPVLEAVAAAADTLADLGADVSKISLPLAHLAGVASHVIIAVEHAGLNPERIRRRPDDFAHLNRVQMLTAELIPASVYHKAQKLRAMIRKQALELLNAVDVLLLPTTSAPAQVMEFDPHLGSMEEAEAALTDSSYRGLFSMVGGPALSICCGFTAEDGVGLPLGMQIGGKPFDEGTVLRIAHAYQQATSWHTRRPPIR
ncbi:MAG: hypothetical protein F4Y49_04125 [Dehalococcoidia bacterium]|nr:hypothetical protein [Dehalococcoidia bacterium]